MSKHETIRAIKNAQVRKLYAEAEAVNPASAPRRNAESRNLKIVAHLKAGARSQSTIGGTCPHTCFCL